MAAPVIVLDASAFISGYDAAGPAAEHYTTPSVREEVSGDDLISIRFDTALQTGRLRMVPPDARYVEEVEEASIGLGEAAALSPTDVEVLALGLQLRAEGKNPVIASDDYSVQNMADHMGLGFKGLSTAGIRRRFDWAIYCPGCHRTFAEPQPDGVCPVCGTTLRRRPTRKRPLGGGLGRGMGGSS